ncbi:MAG: aldo/keto reductase [Planctomycetes bacterium]|nr:aldo/keto reductase [Planctomycetota bacterium]
MFSLAAWAGASAGRSQDAAKPPALERRRFGKTDMQVAVLGFGGAEIGYEGADQPTVDKLLNAALDAGLNVIDTAECYVDSELKIGSAVGARRKDFYLFTKCGHTSEPPKEGPDWTKAGVLQSIERSLKRLKTDVIDLVQLHSCSLEELKKGECIEGLLEAKKQGKTRYVGYSGDSLAAKWAIESGKFDALQTSINVCDQECIELTLPLAKEKGLGVIAKRPIANAVWRYDARPSNDYHVEYWERLQELAYDFATGPLRTDSSPNGAAGIAMRFTAMQPGVSVLIVGTTKPERWAQNAELLRAGPLAGELHDSIRARWKAASKPDWTGRT